MLKLRGLSPQITEVATNVNNDVLAACIVLLREDHYVVFEAALISAGPAPGHRKNRHLVQWPAIKEELQELFQRTLLSVTRTNFRVLIKSHFPDEKPLRVLAEVKEHLRKGRGNETAGYGFVDWQSHITERHISRREHVAAGYERSALQLRSERENPPALDSPEGKDDG